MERYWDDALNKIPLNKRHLILIIACGSMWISVICETVGMGLMALLLNSEFEVEETDTTFLMAASFVGIFVSSYYWGYSCDIWGRRKMLLISGYTFSFLSLCALFAKTYDTYLTIRVLIGMFLAGPLTICPTYLSEFCSHRNRPIIISGMIFISSFAMILVPGLCLVSLFSSEDESASWSMVAIVFPIPNLIGVLILTIFAPPSPKFLVAAQNCEEAVRALEWLHGKKEEEPEVYFLYTDLIRNGRTRTLSKESNWKMEAIWEQTLVLVGPPWGSSFIFYCFMLLGQSIISNCLIMFIPKLQKFLYQSSTGSSTSICELFSVLNNVLQHNVKELHGKEHTSTRSYDLGYHILIDCLNFGLLLVLSQALQGLCIYILGRRRALMISILTNFSSGLLLEYINNLQVSLAIFYTYVIMPTLSTFGLLSGIMDIIPTAYRGKGISVSVIFVCVGTTLGISFMENKIYEHCQDTLLIFHCFFAISVIGITLLPLDEEEEIFFLHRRHVVLRNPEEEQ